MIVRLGQNLGVKLLSLGCSFALFLYVHKQQVSELSFRVPLVINHDPSTRIVHQTSARRMVEVTLTGPADRLKLIEPGTKAVVDLMGQGSGEYPSSPVKVQIPAEARDEVQVNWWPRVVNVRLEEREARRMPVQVTFGVQPPAGWSLGQKTVFPELVLVSGWESEVERVKRVQAVVSSLGSGEKVDVVVPVRAVDEQGIEIGEEVRIRPAMVRVQAPLERSTWFKRVYVSPYLGETPPTVRLRRVSVTPRALTIRGAETAIGQVQFLETEPVVIPGTPGLVDREVRVSLPPGIRTDERPFVRVVIALAAPGS